MELQTHTDVPIHHSLGMFFLNGSLMIIGVVFDLMAELTSDDVYKWTYRSIALVSLIFLAYINFNKAREIYKAKKKK